MLLIWQRELKKKDKKENENDNNNNNNNEMNITKIKKEEFMKKSKCSRLQNICINKKMKLLIFLHFSLIITV